MAPNDGGFEQLQYESYLIAKLVSGLHRNGVDKNDGPRSEVSSTYHNTASNTIWHPASPSASTFGEIDSTLRSKSCICWSEKNWFECIDDREKRWRDRLYVIMGRILLHSSSTAGWEEIRRKEFFRIAFSSIDAESWPSSLHVLYNPVSSISEQSSKWVDKWRECVTYIFSITYLSRGLQFDKQNHWHAYVYPTIQLNRPSLSSISTSLDLSADPSHTWSYIITDPISIWTPHWLTSVPPPSPISPSCTPALRSYTSFSLFQLLQYIF